MCGKVIFGTFVLFLCILVWAHNVQSATLYAAPSLTGKGDCSSWANACTLKTALIFANSGDEVWVKKGVHKPGNRREDSFVIKSRMKVYGGFAGTETTLEQRNWQTNLTILSGDIDDNDTDSNGDGILELFTDGLDAINGNNSYHVVTIEAGATSDTILDGFIITAGQADGLRSPERVGGGLYNVDSSLTIKNCIFSGNKAIYGGGLYNNNSRPIITNCTFIGNIANYSGGGMYNYFYSSPTITNCIFNRNTADGSGGGLYNHFNSNPAIINCIFDGNASIRSIGGGISNNSSSPRITNSIFRENIAYNGGGGYLMITIVVQILLTASLPVTL